MGRGGVRPGAGRKKQQRPVDGNVARKLKAQVEAEKLWVFLIGKAREKAEKTGNTSDLRQALEYLDDRDLGRCVDTVNHLHDKPIQHEVTLKMSEVIREVRERKQQYERNRA